MRKKILAAVDGSSYSTNSLRYLGQLFRGSTDIHVHLLSLVPASGAGPAARDWLSEEELRNSVGPATRAALAARQRYMEQATDTLKRSGIAEEQVSSEVRLSPGSVADDILRAAREGLYDALLIGRRGIGKLEELIMGSVSSSVLDKSHDVPLWIIDGQVDSDTFLVPVDGSCHALKAVDHLAFILAGNPAARVTIFSSQALLAERPVIDAAEFHAIWGKEWCDEHLQRPDSIYHAPKQLLVESGFPEERIFWLQTFKGIDPSRQIVRQALIDDFGTIVMGRRGPDADKGIFRGVSDRVLSMAEQVAVWIIG